MTTLPASPREETWRASDDPVAFEILRHRLWAINDEAATTLKLVSGSTVATEANDLNTAIMDSEGEVVAVGPYSVAKATTMSLVVRDVLANYKDSIGIDAGDAFLCNDPYVGIQHQNDVALVMPVFLDGRLSAWVGAEVHQIDLGGPVPGNVQVGARDIFGEAALIPPIKIVERGQLRADVERHYLRRSRLPDLVALDLRAKWAACNVASERLTELALEWGSDRLRGVMAEILAYAEKRLRARLASLPDSTWRHVTYLDFDEKIFQIRVTMEKRDDSLVFDFRGSSPQAPAIINCTEPSLRAVLFGYVCISLCWDIPWSPSAVARVVSVVTEPGTVMACEWPAGVSKSTTSVSWAVGKTAGLLIGKLLACSEATREHSMASWQGAMVAEELYGLDRTGQRFGTTLVDAQAGAGGARTFRDGIDSGGYLGSMGMSIANVESYEMEYPILYLYRRHVIDGGGAGKWRGGTSIEKAYTPHGVAEIPTFVMHCVGVAVPLSLGNFGGYPAGTNQLVINRRSDVRALLEGGSVPTTPGATGGEREPYLGITWTSLSSEDVYFCTAMGGGGYGDPLERPPTLVADDVGLGLVSEVGAEEVYGVQFRDGGIDDDATTQTRDRLRSERLLKAEPAVKMFAAPETSASIEFSMGEQLRVLGSGETRWLGCSCGCALAPAAANFREYVPVARRPVASLGRQFDPDALGGDQFEVREYFCPQCAALLAVDILERDEPHLFELELNDGRSGP